MNDKFNDANAKLLEALAQVVAEGKTSVQDACQLLNTAARFEERVDAEKTSPDRK